MVLVKTIRHGGTTIVVEAHGEVLFTAVGPFGKFTREFTRAIKEGTRAAAPSNKRQRWAYQGRTLKQSFSSNVAYRPATMKDYSVVASSSGHALYVDQGTKSFQAKILPPWFRGSPSLYESTWRPGPDQPPVGEITVRGQRAQFFFEKGIKTGFAAMRVLSYERPSTAQIQSALRSIPAGVLGAVDTGEGSAFRADLEQWRLWRDTAYNAEGRRLGKPKGRVGSRHKSRVRPKKPKRVRTRADIEHSRRMAAERQQRYRDHKRDQRQTRQESRVEGFRSVGQKNAAAIAAFHKRNPGVRIRRAAGGRGVEVTKGGKTLFIPWATLYNLL